MTVHTSLRLGKAPVMGIVDGDESRVPRGRDGKEGRGRKKQAAWGELRF